MVQSPQTRFLTLAAAAVFLLLGCQRTRVRYQDFVVSGRVSSNRESKTAAQASCGDRTLFGLSVSDGEELSVVSRLGGSPRLVLSGCVAPSPVSSARLRLVVEEIDGKRRREEVMTLGHGWWRQETALEDFAGRQARVRLVASLKGAATLYLSDFFVEERVAPPTGDRRARQLLLISVDTLREDAIGALGGELPTPALDRLVAASQVWSPHYAAASWTKPSHASLLTGHFPEIHQAIHPNSVMNPALTPLAQRFRSSGFLTAGMVHDCLWLNPRFGFAAGFDEYRSVKWQLPQMVRQAVNWMGDHRDTSFFLFLHTFEVHSDFRGLPYEAPGVTRETVQSRFGVPAYGCSEDVDQKPVCASERLKRINSGQIEPLEQEGEILRFLYGQGVMHLDRQLGLLFDRLRQMGMFDPLMIVVTSDHGEEFLEHGGTLHDGYWEEILRVPLIIKWPEGRFGGERREVVSSAVDVAPTLLAAFDLSAGELPGSPLLERRSGRPAIAGTTWRAVIADRLKGVFHRPSGLVRLYDLAADPAEREDLSAERVADVNALRKLLAAHRASLRAWVPQELLSDKQPDRPPLNAEERERLRSLGYLGDD